MRNVDWGALVGLRNLNPRDRRAVLLGAAVLVPALLFVAVVRPYRAALENIRERTASELALLEREETLLAAGPTLPASVEEMQERAHRASQRLVRAANVPLAEAEVTGMLEQIATLSRVLLQEMRGVEPHRGRAAADTASTLRPLRLSVRGESDLEGVLTFLQRIENNPLLLRIAELSIEPVYEGSRDDRIATGIVQFGLIVEAYAPADIDRSATPGEVSQ